MHITYRFTREEIAEILQKHLGLKKKPEVKFRVEEQRDAMDPGGRSLGYIVREVTLTTDEPQALDRLLGSQD